MSLTEVSKNEEVKKITQLVYPKENLQEIPGINLVLEIYMRSFYFNNLNPVIITSIMNAMFITALPFIVRPL